MDIFVCTADPKAEPPLMVVNTVLSMMAYNYPPEKLSVYLSDDGCSDLTFYALLEASRFSKEWLPFCNKFKVEPRSPEAYFRTASQPLNHVDDHDLDLWTSIKVRTPYVCTTSLYLSFSVQKIPRIIAFNDHIYICTLHIYIAMKAILHRCIPYSI